MDRDLGTMLKAIAQINAIEDCRISRDGQGASNEASPANTGMIKATSTSAFWRSLRQKLKAAA